MSGWGAGAQHPIPPIGETVAVESFQYIITLLCEGEYSQSLGSASSEALAKTHISKTIEKLFLLSVAFCSHHYASEVLLHWEVKCVCLRK